VSSALATALVPERARGPVSHQDYPETPGRPSIPSTTALPKLRQIMTCTERHRQDNTDTAPSYEVPGLRWLQEFREPGCLSAVCRARPAAVGPLGIQYSAFFRRSVWRAALPTDDGTAADRRDTPSLLDRWNRSVTSTESVRNPSLLRNGGCDSPMYSLAVSASGLWRMAPREHETLPVSRSKTKRFPCPSAQAFQHGVGRSGFGDDKRRSRLDTEEPGVQASDPQELPSKRPFPSIPTRYEGSDALVGGYSGQLQKTCRLCTNSATACGSRERERADHQAVHPG
jgi:hypothetical protein